MVRFQFIGVPAGKYVARLGSHHATINDADIQSTSTQVAGIVRINSVWTPWQRRDLYFANPLKEIEVDCSAGDANLGFGSDPMFLILDMQNTTGDKRAEAIDGYLYESSGGGPVEMAVVGMHGATMGAIGDAYGSFFTDHNGYFFVVTNSNYAGVDIRVDMCGGAGMETAWTQTSAADASIKHADGSGTRSPDYDGNFGNWRNKVYVARPGGIVTAFPDAARRKIKQRFGVCDDTTIGVPGIPVIMTKCKAVQSDSTGLAVVTAHNRYNYITALGGATPPFGATSIPDYASSPYNGDVLIFSQKGGCLWTVCGGCSSSFSSDVAVAYLGCGVPASGCSTSQPARTLCLAALSAQPNGVGIQGVQSGGKYPVAFWLHDTVGRHNSPQIRGGELGFVFVPNLNDGAPGCTVSPFSPPYPAMALCSLQVTIPAGLFVDTVFKRITFLVGANCVFRDFFSWSADWIQFVDNTGTENITNPTAIRIYFQSLNEYNKQYNFGTNVSWDFLTGQDDPNIPNDVVQFIMNGDGGWLCSIKALPITYDKSGSFFTIDYIAELSTLQNGCLFRVIRPTQNSNGITLPYYEQCLTLDVTNGQLPAGTYTLPYFDSYLLSRVVPVPLLKGQPGPIPPGATPPSPIAVTSTNQNATLTTDGYSENNVNNNNGVLIFQAVDSPTTYPFFFESPSPSDLWGSHLACRGRVGIPNPYEQQYRVGTEIALSNPLADKGIVNGIGTFLSGPVNRKIFDRNAFGDITSVLVEMGVCMVICNNDYFITRYNQSQLQVSPDGQVLGQNSDGGPFTDPQTKVGSNYGVIPQNINTIQRYNGSVVFLDAKGHLIFSDFNNAKPVEKDGYMGYVLNKISTNNIKNLATGANGISYFIGGIDPKTMEYYLTAFNLPPSLGTPTYINTKTQPDLASNETLVFDLESGVLKTFASFTPEMYGRIPGFYLQRQFLSFKQGIPYIHHNNFVNNVAPPAYCNFYGTQCEVRITHVINGVDGKPLPDKVKRFLYNELYVRQSIPGASGVMPSALFFADVINSEKGQTSRILVGRWDQKDGYSCAAFVCATNTPADINLPIQTGIHAILDGDPLQGRWLKVSFTNNSAWTGTYFELSEVVSYINTVEKSAE